MTLPFFLIGFTRASALPLYEGNSLNLLQVGAREISTIGQEGINLTESWNAQNGPLVEYLESLTKDKPNQAQAFWASCTSLTNHGAFFSAELLVGTPPQRFDVVADTGSDAVIIPSCICHQAGSCNSNDRCFRGTDYSSTFHIDKDVSLLSMEFGSGTIEAAIATDIVRVGTTKATMKSGLLLMIDHQLDITGSFEGILGLGQLQGDEPSKAKHHKETWDQPSVKKGSDVPPVPGFLRSAGVGAFSICFNDGDDPGVLRLNTPFVAQPLPSYGEGHWGLNFLGMSVGGAEVPALFCHETEDCGAIPDSGTTLMLGPLEHVRNLFTTICDLWPRCAAEAKRDPLQEKANHFLMLLFSCQSWMGKEGLEELPDIYLHFAGSKGGTTLEISGWSYVFETPAGMAGEHAKLLGGLVGKQLQDWQGLLASQNQEKNVCAPAFGATDIELGTGPLWILGTPLFYEYVVSFDIGNEPPTVGFSSDPCGSCSAETTLLTAVDTQMVIESSHEYLSHRAGQRTIRHIDGPLRVNKHPTQYVRRES